MSHVVDKAATKAARERQARGVKLLDALFGMSPARLATTSDKFTGRPRPVRLRADTPPVRPDAEYRLRRRRRKIAHESRRRNR